MTKSSESRLGQDVVREGLITEDRLVEGLAQRNGHGKHEPFGQELVREKLVTQRQLNLVDAVSCVALFE